ncbi:RNA polymerase subunit sigma-70 [Amycolatopsis orientalis]|uniref:RNA polymerase subunit sigma-70 n=1 Tax=Amycolatopsis orientalis TaxID=31958 RepID=A0A193C8M9_AMYOR|nr:sigma-70 family RNA polymerase sigma factor [Amycolatopsis orientalis]ANN20966.1 RNA polymerase subunit sigma-70 [Amycolatopsis orientalis]
MTLPAPNPVSMLAGHILRRSGLSPAPSPRQAKAPSQDGTTEDSTAATAAAEAAKAEAWELVSAAQGGDTSAFGRLYDRYVDVVYRYVLFRLGDRDLAEDVTSETFLRALRRITSVSYQGRDVGAWFVTIARNIILDHVKSSRFRLEVVTDEVAEPSGAPIGNVGVQAVAGPEQQAISRATRAELLRCVAELGEDQRECIVLRFMQGLSVAETAAIMRRNEGAIKALQHRAVRRLAQLLPTGLR